MPVANLERFLGADFEQSLMTSQIVETSMLAGPGAAAIIFGHPGNLGDGHFCDAINQGGVVLFFDGQTGGLADLSRFVDGELWMLRTNP